MASQLSKLVGTLVGGLAVLAPTIWLSNKYFFPPSQAGVRLITYVADDHEVHKVAQARPALESKVGGDDADMGNALIGFGAQDGARLAAREAALARARGQSTAPASHFVESHHQWNDCVPFYEPLRIEATGYVTNMGRRTRDSFKPVFEIPLDSGYEMVGPDGTVGSNEKGYALPYPDEHHYLAFIGRIADPTSRQPLTTPFLIGTTRILDPARIGATGCLQTAINHNPYLASAEDGFSYSFAPMKAVPR